MKYVAISELKALLSEYLVKVRAGEELIITSRGKPIAKIIPIEKYEFNFSAILSELEKAGLVKKGKGKIEPNFWKILRPKDKEGRILKEFLTKEREQGR